MHIDAASHRGSEYRGPSMPRGARGYQAGDGEGVAGGSLWGDTNVLQQQAHGGAGGQDIPSILLDWATGDRGKWAVDGADAWCCHSKV